MVQGAKVGTGAFIDSTDFMDPDLLEIGDGVAISEGSTVLGHAFKDGKLHFSKARCHSFPYRALISVSHQSCSIKPPPPS